MSFRGGPGRSGATLRVHPHPFGNRLQCGAAHEQAEVSSIDQLARYVLGWSRDQVGECPDLLRRRDAVLIPASRIVDVGAQARQALERSAQLQQLEPVSWCFPRCTPPPTRTSVG